MLLQKYVNFIEKYPVNNNSNFIQFDKKESRTFFKCPENHQNHHYSSVSCKYKNHPVKQQQYCFQKCDCFCILKNSKSTANFLFTNFHQHYEEETCGLVVRESTRFIS